MTRAEVQQGADRRPGGALGARFQIFAEQHKENHHRRSLKIKMRRAVMRRRGQQQPGGKRPGRAGAECDQQIHIACAGTNRREACAPETRAEPKFHEARQAKLHPAAWHPILPEAHADHADQKGGREKPGQHHIAPFTRQRPGGGFFPGF